MVGADALNWPLVVLLLLLVMFRSGPLVSMLLSSRLVGCSDAGGGEEPTMMLRDVMAGFSAAWATSSSSSNVGSGMMILRL